MSQIYFFKFPLKDSLGGAEFHTLKLARHFTRQGEVVKLVTSDQKLFRLFEQNKLPRRRLFVGLEPTSKWSLLLWPLTYLIARRKFKKLLKNIPTDSTLFMQSLTEKLVLTPLTLSPSPLQGERAGVRSIWLEHKIPGRWLKLNPLKFRYLKLSKKVQLTTVSNFARQEFIKFGVPEKNINLVAPFMGQGLINQATTNPKTFTIGILSRLDPEKGVLDFLKIILPALRKHPDWRVLIAGEGSEEQNIKQLINNNNLQDKIKALGWISNLDEFFGQISVLAYPSKVPESFGMAALEAQSRTIPVIASKIGALPEIVGGESLPAEASAQAGVGVGYLVEPDLPEQWTVALEAVNNSFH